MGLTQLLILTTFLMLRTRFCGIIGPRPNCRHCASLLFEFEDIKFAMFALWLWIPGHSNLAFFVYSTSCAYRRPKSDSSCGLHLEHGVHCYGIYRIIYFYGSNDGITVLIIPLHLERCNCLPTSLRNVLDIKGHGFYTH